MSSHSLSSPIPCHRLSHQTGDLKNTNTSTPYFIGSSRCLGNGFKLVVNRNLGDSLWRSTEACRAVQSPRSVPETTRRYRLISLSTAIMPNRCQDRAEESHLTPEQCEKRQPEQERLVAYRGGRKLPSTAIFSAFLACDPNILSDLKVSRHDTTDGLSRYPPIPTLLRNQESA